MSNFVLAVVFLLLALGGVVVRKTYTYLPLRELKRRDFRVVQVVPAGTGGRTAP